MIILLNVILIHYTNLQMRAELVIKSGDTSEVDNDIRKLKEEVVEWEEEIKQQQQLLLEIEQDEG